MSKAAERIKEELKKRYITNFPLITGEVLEQGILLGLEEGKQQALLEMGTFTQAQLSKIVQKAKAQGRKEVFERIEKYIEYYDKISKARITKDIAYKRLQINLKNTFYIIIHSEDFEKLKQEMGVEE